MKELFDDYIDCGPTKFREGFQEDWSYEDLPHRKTRTKNFLQGCLQPTFKNKLFTSYPIGHSKPKYFKYNEQMVNWTRPEENPYERMLKVLIITPKICVFLSFLQNLREMSVYCFHCARHALKSIQKVHDWTIMNVSIPKSKGNLF